MGGIRGREGVSMYLMLPNMNNDSNDITANCDDAFNNYNDNNVNDNNDNYDNDDII